ncbi:MAG: thioredoxin [Alphaproteobacteria bacterium]|nr:MAG: thioredoxin [Alphaproteobacteria bacterium]
MKSSYKKHTFGLTAGFALAAGVCSGLFAANAAAAPDPTCVSYLTVGDSNCKPPAQPEPQRPAQRPDIESMAGMPPKTEVDKYLDSYGKPPREFVEFYLNPTAENATKWVQTYQQMLQKGQDLSRAWSDAEELYKTGQPGAAPLPASAPARLMEPAAMAPAPSPNMPAGMPSQLPAQVAPMPSMGAAPGRFGAFANTAPSAQPTTNGIRAKGVNLTYFFSQTCPYCTRMTPELAVLSKEIANKLTFTCVDVTPVGATSRPDAGYITSKLPCQWRLPNQGEIEMEQVSQTPTLIIQREGEAPVRLSGYVPLAQLRGYF